MTKNRDDSDNCEVETLILQRWRECFRDDEAFTLQRWRECIRDKERILYEKANARMNAERFTWQDLLLQLEMMPKIVLDSISNVYSIRFEPTDDHEAAMYVLILKHWSIRARWIDFLPDETGSKESLGLDTVFADDLRSQVDLSIALCELCFGLHQRIPELREMFAHPILLWYLWEHEQCFMAIQSSGLIPELYHRRPPKDLFHIEASATAKWLSDISPLSKDEEVFPEGIKPGHTCNIESLIITLAAKTAQNRKDDAFRKAYCKFYKAIRRAARYVRDHECFGSREMRNGKIVEAGLKGKRQSRIAEQEYRPGVGYVTSPHVTKSLHETD